MKTQWRTGRRAGQPAVYDTKDGSEIALILTELTPEWRDHLRLIASAPDLLAACHAALSLLTNPDADARDADAVTDKLREAIRNATH